VYCKPLALAACLAAFAAGCSRKQAAPHNQRLAILRFENLSGEASADWIGRALSEIINEELSSVADLHTIPTLRMHQFDALLGRAAVSAPGISAERPLALAAGASRIGYGDYTFRRGRLEVTLTIENAATGKMASVLSASAAQGDVVGAATALARRISPAAAAYPTRNATAVRGFVSAMENAAPGSVVADLTASIAADPNFGPPYRLLAQWRAQHDDRDGALALLGQALARGNAIAPAERARIELDEANLRNDAAGRERALVALSKLDPRDANVWRTLGQSSIVARNFRQAVNALQKALEIEPDDTGTLNQLGYAAAYAGDLETGIKALQRYQSLRPADPNPLDSLGDIHLIAGRLREAEGFYLEGAKKDPNFQNGADLFKAAMARLMTGDIDGADTLAKPYIEASGAQSPVAAARGAEWQWISGRRKAACDRLEAFVRAHETGETQTLASRAWGELAVWRLMLGDRAAAEQASQRAMATMTQQSGLIAAMARLLAQPEANAAEWQARVDRLFNNPAAQQVKSLTLAYALLLGKEFQAAAPILARLNQTAGIGGDENVPLLLAWSLVETGHVKEAEPLLKPNPVPSTGGVTLFMSFYFPRIYYLRGLSAQNAGRPEEAKENYRLFLKLSGPDPLIWGEEQKASGLAQ
jgi:Flp pilus assembly protein TadD